MGYNKWCFLMAICSVGVQNYSSAERMVLKVTFIAPPHSHVTKNGHLALHPHLGSQGAPQLPPHLILLLWPFGHLHSTAPPPDTPHKQQEEENGEGQLGWEVLQRS